MRQEHETAKSLNELKAITQAIMLKKGTQANATHQESERTQEANNANAKAHTQEPTQTRAQTSENANISDLTQRTGLKPKAMLQTKKERLNPTKKAFSMRQKTTLKKGLQESETLKNGTQANANAFKPEQTNKEKSRANKPLKPGLGTHQEKGGSNEA
ncbi:hypothetical protein KVD99_07220 [Helicobacter pylori]|nr:hypothetical protein KVD99_07220 [Helicobacter pylori]